MIRLGRCLDLLDPANVGWLKAMHEAMIITWRAAGVDVPRNGNQRKKLDCAVFNNAYTRATDQGRPIDTARAVYVPTESANRAWERSWIYDEAHIQICVRNEENILAAWHVREDGRYGVDRA